MGLQENKEDDIQSIAYAATITPDAFAGDLVIVGVLTGNITIANPTNPKPGGRLVFELTQDATGSRTVTWGNAFLTEGFTPSTAANAVDTVEFRYDGTNWVCDNYRVGTATANSGYQAVAYAATVNINRALGGYVKVGTLTGNVTIANPTNGVAGDRLTVDLTQDGTGSRTVTWGSAFLAALYTASTTAAYRDVVNFAFDGTKWVYQSSAVHVA